MLQQHSISRRFRRKINSSINVTPLVDVMLVLLIIFMVTSPMLVSEIKVDLPQTNLDPIAKEPKIISITIDKNKNLYLNDKKIVFAELNTKLRELSKRQKNSRIFVRSDQSVNYGFVVKIIDHLNNSGFDKVSLVTESK